MLPYALICFWLWRAGVWEKFWFWTVTYASKYVQRFPLSVAGSILWQNGSGIVRPNWPLGLLALVGMAGVAILGRGKPGMRSFVFGFLAFSFFCVCPGFYFREHYFVVMLPAVAMLAGVGCRLLWDLAAGRFWASEATLPANGEHRAPNAASRHKRGHPKHGKPESQAAPLSGFGPLSALVVLLLAAAPLWTIFGTTLWQSNFFFTWEPHLACRIVYFGNPFVECPVVANYLQEHTTANETVAVLGSEPEVFFDARRNSATGYIYTYGLMEPQPLAEWMQGEMIAEIKASKPKFIIVADVYFSWLYSGGSKFIIQEWADRYLHENYDLVGVVERPVGSDALYRWDESGASLPPHFQWIKVPPQLPGIWNNKGEKFKLGLVGSLAGYEPNIAGSECVLWICRKKPRAFSAADAVNRGPVVKNRG